jgi:hypothetical protein
MKKRNHSGTLAGETEAATSSGRRRAGGRAAHTQIQQRTQGARQTALTPGQPEHQRPTQINKHTPLESPAQQDRKNPEQGPDGLTRGEPVITEITRGHTGGGQEPPSPTHGEETEGHHQTRNPPSQQEAKEKEPTPGQPNSEPTPHLTPLTSTLMGHLRTKHRLPNTSAAQRSLTSM